MRTPPIDSIRLVITTLKPLKPLKPFKPFSFDSTTVSLWNSPRVTEPDVNAWIVTSVAATIGTAHPPVRSIGLLSKASPLGLAGRYAWFLGLGLAERGAAI